MPAQQLEKNLGIFTVWGLGVGYVISGIYFGWNLGLPLGGPYGLLIALCAITLMYICAVFCYAELACAMPKAGGAFVYATRALGPTMGYVAGLAQIIEFVFAPPAIAAAIGAYFSLFFDNVSPFSIALVAYLIFTGLNIYGVKQSAIFELFITIFAVFELLLFAGLTLPSFSFAQFSHDAWPKHWTGFFACLPYAIWFYLAIEGVANVAEEAKNPKKTISRGFLLAMGTLVALAFLTLFAAVGIGGWESVVFANGVETPSDSPLPLALQQVVGESSVFYHLLIFIGLFGLVASFHGILLAAGRASFEFGRAGCGPAWLGKIHPKRHTPAWALIANGFVGVIALSTGKTGEMIQLSVFGALLLYVLSMISFLRLRRAQPQMERPFVAPLYPVLPIVALVLAAISLVSMAIFQTKIAVIFLGILVLGLAYLRAGAGYEARKANFG